MSDYADELIEQEAREQYGPEDKCENCGHTWREHQDKYGCEHDRGDAWVTGNQASAPTVLMAQGPCGCVDFILEVPDAHE